MNTNLGHFLDFKKLYLVLVGGIGMAALTASQIISAEYLQLAFVTLAMASFLFLLVQFERPVEQRARLLARPRILDTGLFLSITTTALVGQFAHEGVADLYYPLVIAAVGLLAYRLCTPPFRTWMQLSQVVLLAMVVRATLWYSFPVVGHDSRRLPALTGYVVETGYVISEQLGASITSNIGFYSQYPLTQLFTAVTTVTMGTSTKVGVFSVSIAAALGLTGVFLLGRGLVDDVRGGFLAALFVAVYAYHIKLTGEVISQTLYIALLPFVLYLLVRRERSRRLAAVLIVLLLTSMVVHNIAPLALGGITGLIAIVALSRNLILDRVGPLVDELPARANPVPLLATCILAVTGVYHYIMAGYLRFQVMRLVAIIQTLSTPGGVSGQSVGRGTSGSKGGSGITEPNTATGVPVAELFGHELPAVLSWAAPLLIAGGILSIVGYYALSATLSERRDFNQAQWSIIPIVAFGAFFILFLSGTGVARRALPDISILIAPSFAWIGTRFVSRRQVGKAIVVGMLIVTASAGVLTPAVAKAELPQDQYHPYLESDQVEAVSFAADRCSDVTTESYVVSYNQLRQMEHGDGTPGRSFEAVLSKNSRSSIRDYMGRGKHLPSLYFEYYGAAYDISPPGSSTIYSSGNATVHTGGRSSGCRSTNN